MDDKAKAAYQALLVITLEDKSKYPEWIRVNQTANKDFANLSATQADLTKFYNPAWELSYYAAAYYDCIMYAALTYNIANQQANLTGHLTDSNPAYTLPVSTILWGRTVVPGIAPIAWDSFPDVLTYIIVLFQAPAVTCSSCRTATVMRISACTL